mmetsp:Transcript_21355/g.29379  ORF Transcript_21355/g.29379 Transcript_21355/m.29379 type:complete len:123 (+) Transcript_21355:130-498(+)
MERALFEGWFEGEGSSNESVFLTPQVFLFEDLVNAKGDRDNGGDRDRGGCGDRGDCDRGCGDLGRGDCDRGCGDCDRGWGDCDLCRGDFGRDNDRPLGDDCGCGDCGRGDCDRNVLGDRGDR